jgi:hypothetical protein
VPLRNRISLLSNETQADRAIQKLTPSLHAPNETLPAPVETFAMKLRSAALNTVILFTAFVRHQDALAVSGVTTVLPVVARQPRTTLWRGRAEAIRGE